MFEKEEIKRYSRQIMLPEISFEGQKRLKEARVLVVGAGGLGCPVLQYLTAAGVGNLGIIDDDVVDESNLHRQILYSHADLGLNKALAAREKLQLMNPYTLITAYPERLTGDNIVDVFGPYDLVIDGSDNFPTRYLVSDACSALNKPLIFGSVYQFEGQVSVFNYEGGPAYRDLFPEPPADGDSPNCSDIGVIGVLPGMTGTFMANEAIKVICGAGETLSGRLLVIDGLAASVKLFRFCQTETAPAHRPAPENPVETQGDSLTEMHSVTMSELTSWLEDIPDEVCLVDVREVYEFEEYNIGGVNIPLYELSGRLSELPRRKSRIVFCCQTGYRSRKAVSLVKPFLETEIFSLEGGIY